MEQFLKENKILMAILVGALIIAGAIYLSIRSQTSPEFTTSQVLPQPTITLEERRPTQTLIPEATATATIDDSSVIKTALAQKLGMDEEDIEATVTQNTGSHAKGGVKEKGAEVGGGYFLAAKDEGAWVIVYDGQAQPPCEDIEKYDFPKSMVPECLDESGQVVSR